MQRMGCGSTLISTTERIIPSSYLSRPSLLPVAFREGWMLLKAAGRVETGISRIPTIQGFRLLLNWVPSVAGASTTGRSNQVHDSRHPGANQGGVQFPAGPVSHVSRRAPPAICLGSGGRVSRSCSSRVKRLQVVSRRKFPRVQSIFPVPLWTGLVPLVDRTPDFNSIACFGPFRSIGAPF